MPPTDFCLVVVVNQIWATTSRNQVISQISTHAVLSAKLRVNESKETLPAFQVASSDDPSLPREPFYPALLHLGPQAVISLPSRRA